MAKTAQFDRINVVEKASNLYWQKGFHATSMRNLQDVIDMRPGSIYASFGSKEGLFKEALQKYAEQSQATLAKCLATHDSPVKALKAFYAQVIGPCSSDEPNEMCMLVKTISELTEENGEILALAKQLMHQIEITIAQIISTAFSQKEIVSEKSPEQIASYLQIQLIGVRTYVHASVADINVAELIEDIFTNGPFKISA